MPYLNDTSYKVIKQNINISNKIDRILFISDIHSNLKLLKQFEEKAKLDTRTQVIVLGDILHGGEYPSETLNWMMQNIGKYAIIGNHDELVIYLKGDKSQPKTTESGIKALLTETQIKYLSNLPNEIILSWQGKIINIMHGHRDRCENGVSYESSQSFMVDSFANTEVDLTVMGHTHNPFIYSDLKTQVANCGAITDVIAESRSIIGSTWLEVVIENNKLKINIINNKK